MTRMTLAFSLVLASGFGASAAQRAQTPAPEPAHKVFVLNGCLEQGAAPAVFKLTNASVIGQAPPRPSVTPTSKDANVYDLQAAGGVSEEGLSRDKLQAELGARVEVTIRPIEVTAPAQASTARKDAGDKPLDGPEPPQRYTVVKINRLASSCP